MIFKDSMNDVLLSDWVNVETVCNGLEQTGQI